MSFDREEYINKYAYDSFDYEIDKKTGKVWAVNTTNKGKGRLMPKYRKGAKRTPEYDLKGDEHWQSRIEETDPEEIKKILAWKKAGNGGFTNIIVDHGQRQKEVLESLKVLYRSF